MCRYKSLAKNIGRGGLKPLRGVFTKGGLSAGVSEERKRPQSFGLGGVPSLCVGNIPGAFIVFERGVEHRRGEDTGRQGDRGGCCRREGKPANERVSRKDYPHGCCRLSQHKQVILGGGHWRESRSSGRLQASRGVKKKKERVVTYREAWTCAGAMIKAFASEKKSESLIRSGETLAKCNPLS